MPSSTVKDRTTKVKVAGNLKGLSADATSKSSPAAQYLGLDASNAAIASQFLYSRLNECTENGEVRSKNGWKLKMPSTDPTSNYSVKAGD